MVQESALDYAGSFQVATNTVVAGNNLWYMLANFGMVSLYSAQAKYSMNSATQLMVAVEDVDFVVANMYGHCRLVLLVHE